MPTFKLKVFNYYSLGGSIMWGWILRVSWWQILLVCRNSLVRTWSNIPIKTDQCGWLLIGTPPTVELTYLTFETFSLDQNSEMRASSHIIVSQMSGNQSCRRGSFFSWRGVVGTRDHCLTHKHKHCLTHKCTVSHTRALCTVQCLTHKSTSTSKIKSTSTSSVSHTRAPLAGGRHYWADTHSSYSVDISRE